MSILLFTSELSEKNGWGRYSLDLAVSLQKKRQEVLVICHRRNENFPKIKQLALLYSPLSYRANYLLFGFTALRLGLLTRRYQVEVVHCLVETYAPVAWFYSILKMKPMFMTVHGSFGLKPLSKRWSGLVQKMVYLSKRTRVICVSNYTKSRLTEKLGFCPRASVIPNGVDFAGSPQQPLLSIREPLVLLGVGALKQRKGFHLVVEALPLILKRFPGLNYWIVGDQSDKEYVNRLKIRAGELNLLSRIVFFENISDQKLKELYGLASLFILTPLSDEYNFEGFGLVYLEANSFGLPVVGMKGNGGEEAIIHGQTGLLVETGDIKSIADSVVDILDSPKDYAMMSVNALRQAQNHSWTIIAARYIDSYRN